MAKQTVAELLVATLAQAGVRRVYGIAGDSLNGVTDAIRRSEIRWVPVRHEEAGAFAAGAEAQLTGQLAVCAGSSGPGNLHLINGLYDAQRSRTPVLAIVAHIPSREIGSGYFQETHPEQLFRECSHYCELVSHPYHIRRVIEIAIRTAVAQRGVAVVVLPGDIALQTVNADPPHLGHPHVTPRILPSEDEMSELARVLNGARKVTILAGAGCAGAHAELMAVADKLKAPIVHAMRGKDVIEYDNPYDVGMTGLLGFSSGYYAMMNCDTLLMLGTDFPYQQFYPEHATIVQIDVRGEQIGRRTTVDLGLVGEIQTTLAALVPRLNAPHDEQHLRDALQQYARARQGLADLAAGVPGRRPVHPQYVARQIDELAAPDAIFTCDVGTPTIWAARYLTMNGQRRLLGSFTHGSMANALPQAIGAQLSQPGRQVIALSGDGGLAMLMGELLTLRQLHLPVKMVVFQNNALSFVEIEMKAAGFLDWGTELDNPDLAQIAQAAGLLGLHAETPEQVRPALEQALRSDGPAVIAVDVNRQELAMPPTLNREQVTGFGIFLVKAVLNGRGDELIDLARTNVRR